jgi:hypothetical protein
MVDADPETALIRAFVVPAKQERYLAFVSSPRRRRKFLEELRHFRDFDPTCVVEIPGKDHHATTIEQLLRDRAAPTMCFVVSTDRAVDRQILPLAEVLPRIVGGTDHGTLLSCIPGRLGYFEGEGPKDRFVLARPLR